MGSVQGTYTGGGVPSTHTAEPQGRHAQHRGRAERAGTGAQAQSIHRHTAREKKEQKSTQEYIVMCYDDSVEHKGSDQTVAPNHSTCSPQRGHTKAQTKAVSSFCCSGAGGKP